MLLLYQLSDLLNDRQGQNEIIEPLSRLGFKDCVFADLSARCRGYRRRHRNGIQGTLQTVRKNVMILAPLFCHRSFDGRTQRDSIAGRTGDSSSRWQ